MNKCEYCYFYEPNKPGSVVGQCYLNPPIDCGDTWTRPPVCAEDRCQFWADRSFTPRKRG